MAYKNKLHAETQNELQHPDNHGIPTTTTATSIMDFLLLENYSYNLLAGE